MLEQLIKEWREQAARSQGMRGYVFAVCADQLEEVFEKMEAQGQIKSNGIEFGNVHPITGGVFTHEKELRSLKVSEERQF